MSLPTGMYMECGGAKALGKSCVFWGGGGVLEGRCRRCRRGF